MPRLVYNICINTRVHTSFNVFSLCVRYACHPIIIVTNIVLNRSYFLRYPNKTFLCIGLDDFITTYLYTRRGIPLPPPILLLFDRFLRYPLLGSFFRGVSAVRLMPDHISDLQKPFRK